MQNLIAGLRTGSVAWLAEIDLIRDDLPDGREQDGLVVVASPQGVAISFRPAES